MEEFKTLTSIAVKLLEPNIDTDQILPSRYIQKPRENDFSKYLFEDVRKSYFSENNSYFTLDEPGFKESRIIITGTNFGCGSSREHAVWALVDSGFKVLIGTTFGDIFYSNCLKNGLLPIRLVEHDFEVINNISSRILKTKLTIDLNEQLISTGNKIFIKFEIDKFYKYFLTRGLDEINFTLTYDNDINNFEINKGIV